MDVLSTISQENSTTKRFKISRSKLEVYRKVIAFEEILSLNQHTHSARDIAALLHLPNSTMQSWRSHKNSQELTAEVAKFFSTLPGQEFLQRITMSATRLYILDLVEPVYFP